jgi:hypothetical protein
MPNILVSTDTIPKYRCSIQLNTRSLTQTTLKEINISLTISYKTAKYKKKKNSKSSEKSVTKA